MKPARAILSVALVSSLYTGNALAQSCTSNEPTNPCYSQVNDILGGDRDLLPDDDIIFTVRRDSGNTNDIEVYWEETTSLAISKSTGFDYSRTCTSYPVGFTQSVAGRIYSKAYDTIVNFRPTTSCDEINMFVVDPQDDSNNTAIQTNLGDPSKLATAGMALADFNLDGYADIIYVNDDGAQVFTPKCTEDPFADCTANGEGIKNGLNSGPKLSITNTGPYSTSPVTGDLNGDGYADAAWAEYDGDKKIAVRIISVCPAADIELFGKTCSQPLEIIKSGLDIATTGVFDATGQGTPRPVIALTFGNFDANRSETNGLGSDELLVALSDSDNNAATLTLYQYDENSSTLSSQSTLTITDLKKDDSNNLQLFLGAAYLDANAAKPQGILSSTKDSDSREHRGFVSTLTFADDFTMTEHRGLLPNNDKTRIFGMAVGRFDPPDDNNGDTDYNEQIAVIIDHDDDDTLLQIWTADTVGTAPAEASQHTLSSDRLYDSSIWQMNSLIPADIQGRSLILGAPEKVTISQVQPNLILGLPPLHVDFITPPESQSAGIFNVSVWPVDFNVGFEFSESMNTSAEHQGTTSYTGAYKESVELKNKYEIPDEGSITIKFKASAQEQHSRNVTKTFNNYSGKSYSFDAVTTFDDLVSFTSKSVNIYTYPVIGQFVCPADTPDCSDSEKEPLVVQYSGPDNIVYAEPAEGGTLEWYQPVTEPGNLFSYAGNLNLLEQAEPQQVDPSTGESVAAITFLTPENMIWGSLADDQVKVEWTAGAGAARSVQLTDAFSFDIGISVKFKESDIFTESSQKFGFETNQSFSTTSMNTGTQTFDASFGVNLDRGVGSEAQQDELEYQGQTLVYAMNPSFGAIQTDAFDTPPSSTTISAAGPMKVGHVADMVSTSSIQSGDWWKTAYAHTPDIALNHPQRWFQKEPVGSTGQQMRFACPIGYTSNFGVPDADPGSCTTDDTSTATIVTVANRTFYQMKGLFVTPEDSLTGPNTILEDLDSTLNLQARIYNYSLANLDPGDVVKVHFYAQAWDNGEFKAGSGKNGFEPAIFIGEDTIQGGIPGFCGGAATDDPCSETSPAPPPNWVIAATQWDTSTISPQPIEDTAWVFWVVAWIEDSGGNLQAELTSHGLNTSPTDTINQPIDSPADIDVELYSNNVGFYNQPLTLAIPESSDSVPAGDERELAISGFALDDINVVQDVPTIARVQLDASGGNYDGVVALLYEQDSNNTLRLIDMDLVSRVSKDGRWVVPFRYNPRDCGQKTLTARIFQSDGNLPLAQSIDVDVSCEPIGIRAYKGQAKYSSRHKHEHHGQKNKSKSKSKNNNKHHGKGGNDVKVQGSLALKRELELWNEDAVIVLDHLLFDALNDQELVHKLPITLDAKSSNSQYSAVYVSNSRKGPDVRMEIKATNEPGIYRYRIEVSDGDISKPEECPIRLTTRFEIDDGVDNGVLLSTVQSWRCAGKSNVIKTK